MKNYLIIMASMLVVFVAGCLAVARTVGKIDVECAVGYGACLTSALVAICTTVTMFVMKREDKKNERTL